MDDEKICQYCKKTYRRSKTEGRSRWEGRRFCSPPCGNKSKKSPWLVKYQIKKGEHLGANTQFKKGDMAGESNPKWKGDSASYVAKHIWARNHFGVPQECELCRTTEIRMYHWANISGEYKRERSDWMRLCVPCHKRYDLNKRRDQDASKETTHR